MTSHILSRAALALALMLAAAPVPSLAQEVVQPLPGTTDADKLGDVMRRVAQNPRDVNALIQASDLSIRLDDLSGAASLLARAEKVDARDPRIKAGMGSILVRSERPGEALRYFAQAEAAGLPPVNYAADRGLAYDLTGDQPRAQADYRLALAKEPSDEVIRRYALSLGISGQRERALEQLDPLLRKTDRAAWRARAFILAMGGDLPEATRIAGTMMPAQLAQGLQPFFQRLPSLPAVDRAFAVHFGETRATPERLADARLAPVLPALTPEAPVALASTQTTAPVTPVATRNDRRRGGRETRSNRGVALAAAVPVQSVPTTRTNATPAPARVVAAASPMRMIQPLPSVSPSPQPSTQPQPQPGFSTALPATTSSATPVATASTATPAAPMVQPLPANPTPAPVAAVPAPVQMAQAAPVVQPIPTQSAPTLAATTTSAPTPTSTAPVPAPVTAMVQPLPPVTEPSPSPVTRTARAVTRRPTPAAARAMREDSVLARIVANLSIPASELGIEGPERSAVVAATAPMTSGSQRVLAEAKAKTERDRDAAAKAEEAAETAAKPPVKDAKTLAAEKKAALAKAAADKKALAAKKAEAEKKALADKQAAEEKRLARANPERIWVQVAGGANESDLPKAWAAAKAKAPTLFAGRHGYKTPLRATHRVLTGPFKTDAEARGFVNQLAKQGLSAFPVTSDAGQVVTRLDAK